MNKLQVLLAWIHDLDIKPDEAVRLLATAPHQYRHYTIAKKTGGLRDIFHPSPQLKQVQRWVVRNVLSSLPVHPSVHSYVLGRSIRTHAEVHRQSNYLLRLDFTDFFPSLDQPWITRFLRQSVNAGRLDLEADALNMLTRILCRYSPDDRTMALSIGAPSSPFMSNVMLYELDSALFNMASNAGAEFSRYADDIYFSARNPHILNSVERQFRSAVTELTPSLRINDHKTEHRSRKTRRVITGLILTPDRKLSIGRGRKRSIRSQTYQYSQGQLSIDASLRLAGLLSFAADVEPSFVDSLRTKFGHHLIDRLIAHEFIRDDMN